MESTAAVIDALDRAPEIAVPLDRSGVAAADPTEQ